MSSFDQAQAVRLSDRNYLDFILASLEVARHRVWVSMFLCDIRPPRDIEGQVLDLLMALIERHQTGVDVRVLLSGVARTPDIDVANLTSGLFLTNYQIPHRRIIGSPDRAGSHAKFVVCDDLAVIGSQNWTDDAFRLNIEDAIIVMGQPTALIAQEFVGLWASGKGMPRL